MTLLPLQSKNPHSFKPKTDAMQYGSIVGASIIKPWGIHENQSSTVKRSALWRIDDFGAKLGSARDEVVAHLCYLPPCDVIDELKAEILLGKAVDYDSEVLTVLFPTPVGPMILKDD